MQHRFFETKKEEKGYLTLLKLYSKDIYKKAKAHQFLAKQLEELFSVTNLKRLGPYHLQTTVKLLSESYKCQFFIFDGLSNASKLVYMFPFNYDDSLKPIYLYRPAHERNHIIFIKHISSYFRSNYSVCFACRRKFKDSYHKHLCKQRKCCFVCRRFMQSCTTYLHEKLDDFFCDRNVTQQKSFKCSLCNCTIFSKKCMRGHKKLCNGKGYFGFKCDRCQKFLTSCKGQTSIQMRETHVCTGEVACRVCFEKKDHGHLCKLKHLKMPSFHTRLGFFKIKTLSTFPYDPILMLVLREEENDDGLRGHFTKYLLKHELLKDPNEEFKNFYTDLYFPNNAKHSNFDKTKNSEKITTDFQVNVQQLYSSKSFNTDLLLFFLEKKDTTYICQDEHSYTTT